MTHPLPTEAELAHVAEVTTRIRASISTVLSGLDQAITATLAVVLA